MNRSNAVLIKLGFLAILITAGLVIFYYYHQAYIYPIKLVKESYSPRDWIKTKEGDLTIYGWGVKKVKDKPNTYIVSYKYATTEDRGNSVTRGWLWELNSKERIIKYITGDGQLEARYGVYRDDGQEEENDFHKKTFYEYKKEREEETRAKWRRLKKGLTEFQVRDMLGEPSRIDAYASTPSFIQWSYPKKGTVRFYAGSVLSDRGLRLDAWREPALGSKVEWRRLQKGMSQDQVTEILGGPERVDAFASSLPFIKWTYPNGSSIKFYSSGMFFNKSYKAEAWQEPHWKDL